MSLVHFVNIVISGLRENSLECLYCANFTIIAGIGKSKPVAIGMVKVTKGTLVEFDFVDTKEAAELLKCHRNTINKQRQQWVKGIHFVSFGGRYFYNRLLLLNLVQCSGEVNSEEHQRAIAFYLANRLDNQPLPRRKR
ncbi:MAG: helix-turn-helix domain-containing protein [Symploca sp. SIO1C2]|nr:helix-turn-helix domain-containing protein [Symploca sp. SIO1C2]